MRLLLLCTLPVLALACHAPSAPAPDASGSAPEPTRYTLVQIKTGPMSGKLSKEDNERAFAGHFENMGRMGRAGQLVTAGPYGARRHDPSLRGLFVLATAERSEAERWAATDPTTQAGVFVLEFHTLATDAPLAAALERALAWQAAQLAAGRTPPPGEGARGYVLLTAEHGDLATREFAPLCDAEGGVYLVATLDETRALVLLDAPDLATAEERFAPQLAVIGTHTLDEWFASDELAAMVE